MKSLGSFIPTSIAQNLARLRKLNLILCEIAPPEFLGHIQVGSLENGILHIFAESSAWASKLRFHQRTLAGLMSVKAGIKITALRISVAPQKIGLTARPAKKPYISSNSAQSFETLANSIQHPQLRRSLLSLAAKRGHRR